MWGTGNVLLPVGTITGYNGQPAIVSSDVGTGTAVTTASDTGCQIDVLLTSKVAISQITMDDVSPHSLVGCEILVVDAFGQALWWSGVITAGPYAWTGIPVPVGDPNKSWQVNEAPQAWATSVAGSLAVLQPQYAFMTTTNLTGTVNHCSWLAATNSNQRLYQGIFETEMENIPWVIRTAAGGACAVAICSGEHV